MVPHIIVIIKVAHNRVNIHQIQIIEMINIWSKYSCFEKCTLICKWCWNIHLFTKFEQNCNWMFRWTQRPLSILTVTLTFNTYWNTKEQRYKGIEIQRLYKGTKELKYKDCTIGTKEQRHKGTKKPFYLDFKKIFQHCCGKWTLKFGTKVI